MCSISVFSQELTVKSFGIILGDLSARTHERVDANKMPCGLVKVQLAAAGATFDETGFVIGNVERRGSEYWVYMNQGSYLLQVDCPGFLPLKINLRDYGLKDGIQGKVTYSLVIVKPAGYAESQDDGMRFVALSVEPKMNAIVYIDEKLQNLQNGAANILLPMGQHTYRVEAQGYESQSGTFNLGDEKLPLNIQLRSNLATLSVSCPTTGSELFINDERRGTMPWQGQLPAGTYRVEARLSGYRSQRQSVTMQQRGNETVTLPALSAIAGQLSVNYLPQNAEVWLDGKQLGTTPDIFRGIIIGTHDVEIRKSGYETKHERVTIAEGQTASLTGTLLAANSQNTASNTYTNSASSSSSSSTGIEAITVNGVTFNMVHVEGGTFQMGSNDSEAYGNEAYGNEKPVHQVTLSSYSIGETEVTQALWEAVMGSNPSNWKGSNLPVEKVSWKDCQEFITRLNQKTGRSFRLPTEAEWEFAARGGNKSRGYKYSGSNDFGSVAWYKDNSSDKTHAVKTKQPNELGLYDMSGNVYEWCQDWYGSYSSSAQTNPEGPSSGSCRVVRGGCWGNDAGGCRSSDRFDISPSHRISFLGFRLAL